jgi:hypothetical protein
MCFRVLDDGSTGTNVSITDAQSSPSPPGSTDRDDDHGTNMECMSGDGNCQDGTRSKCKDLAEYHRKNVRGQKELLMQAVLDHYLAELCTRLSGEHAEGKFVFSVEYNCRPVEGCRLIADGWILVKRPDNTQVGFWLEFNEDFKIPGPHATYDTDHEWYKARRLLEPRNDEKGNPVPVHGIHVGVDSRYPVVENPVTYGDVHAMLPDGTSFEDLCKKWGVGETSEVDGWNRKNAETLCGLIVNTIERLLSPSSDGEPEMVFIAYDQVKGGHDVHWPKGVERIDASSYVVRSPNLENTDDVVRFAASLWPQLSNEEVENYAKKYVKWEANWDKRFADVKAWVVRERRYPAQNNTPAETSKNKWL